MKVKDIAYYVTDKVCVKDLTPATYVGIDNILPKRGGIVPSSYLPGDGEVIGFRKGDVLIGNIRPYFKKIWLASFDGGCSPDVLCLRSRGEVDSEFLYCVLSQDDFFEYVTKGAKGSKMPRGDKNHILNFPVRRIADEGEIGSLITRFNRKIEVNNEILLRLESLVRFVYRYWFVQFDFPNEKGEPYKSSGGKMVWNEELKQAIPEGWSVGKISDIIKTEKSGDWGEDISSDNYSFRVKCIRGADFPSLLGKGQLVAPDRYILTKNKNKCLEAGDFIIEISGGSPVQSTGRICYINDRVLNRFECPVVVSNFCKAISLKDPDMGYWFFTTWTLLYESGVFFNYEGKTTGIKNLLFSSFCDSCKIALPDKDLLRKYQVMMEEIFCSVQINNDENVRIAKLRDFLLPLLMNGQVIFS